MASEKSSRRDLQLFMTFSELLQAKKGQNHSPLPKLPTRLAES